ncbi:MAG: tRNA (cytidine(56)-2'-O)-methyltransferase [Candidatus Diapherotrites archaeon]|uniref:tRNA (cytidine(56)-2'-O)-methyltransferase n=1 Tax=Candidatus Iainarchaeum sp. TaxID=3101447 RepID=A0A8T5GFF8_9ARCH|nr:tRNA (cytidine(56)-2'-O)-methyltransferase [Candidatus Diapherotrites archaeon]MBT7241770.1 tRNA (cytidine(56)-2'-O)-methyltransferase [Candidatus Diapherotrites archaeon]
MSEIIVFRYGHRDVRDYRVTSHCALVSRAFGATSIIICGNKDEKVTNTLKGVTKRWGGKFKVKFVKTWEKELANLKKKGFVLVHLTMYGEMIQNVDKKIGKNDKICIIIGSRKVESGIYEISDYNVSVTNQPHSEIAALSVCLDRIQNGNELKLEFSGAERKIIPKKQGKEVIPLK